MAIQIQIRRDTAANWTSVDPILAEGEFGLETDTNQIKIGDGVLAWTSLAYFISGNPFDQDLNTTDAVVFAGLTNNAIIYPTSDGTAGQVIVTDGAGNLSFASAANPFDQDLNTTDPVVFAGLTNNSIIYPVADGTVGQVIVTDGAGNLSFASTANPFDQDLNTTDPVVFAGLTNNSIIYPTVDGTAGQVIVTDGSGNLSFVSPSGGVTSITAGTGISVDVTTGAVTVTNSEPDQTVVLTNGTDISITGTYPSFTIAYSGTAGSGTVTKTSVVSANGFAGTVATDTTTPAITISTSITGLLKGDGIAISAATSGTDYIAPSGALGTPSSGTLTSCTGLPVSTGVSGLGTNVATFLATPSSANLAAALTDETGTGANVFATSPTLITPVLGTPSSGDLTNCTFPTLNQSTTGNAATVTTNANLTGVITSVGNATSIASQTGTGTTFVMDTSPTLITPVLGTPTSGTLTNCTFPTLNQNTTGSAASLSATLAVASGGTGVTTSTGSGANALATSPTLVTPILGTPSSGTLTSCTGLPISTGVSGLGTSVATFLATPSSANLASCLTDETGSGLAVFATSPTLTTATITSLVETKTAPAISSGTLTLNCSLGNVFAVSLNAAITTLTISNIPTTGNAFGITLAFTMDGTARAVTWGAAIKWSGGTAPTLTSTNAKVDIFVLTTWDGGTTWYAMVGGQNF